MIAPPKLAGILSRSQRFYATGSVDLVLWHSMMCGEDERPISFGDKSIKFIRLTLANTDGHFD
jgi:hypothetical protein